MRVAFGSSSFQSNVEVKVFGVNMESHCTFLPCTRATLLSHYVRKGAASWQAHILKTFLFNASRKILIFVNNQLDAKFFLIYAYSILYMFWIAMCSSSVELIVSIRHLVYVTLCRLPSGMQVSSKHAYQTVIYPEWHIPDVVLIQLILLMMDT